MDAFRQKFEEVDEEMPSVADDQLRLIFTCCHPALSAESQVALTPIVLACVYLVFTEGYSATAGESAVRAELCDEALRLGRLLSNSRARGARGVGPVGPDVPAGRRRDTRRRDTRRRTGRAVPLDEQNRGRWNRERIAEGLACMTVAGESGGGRYAIEASIAAAHAVAPTFVDTDWSASSARTTGCRHCGNLRQCESIVLWR
ncbi:hypothetical protein GS438_25415 [Rhodococcus hoagii]|nr:hypothetical protein [Prescottella equi]